MPDPENPTEKPWWTRPGMAEAGGWLLLALALLPLARPYWTAGYQVGHDLELPFMRVDALRRAYAAWDLPPRWFPMFDGGYGSPYPAFYGMLFYHVAAWFNLLGLAPPRCVELCAFLTFVGSAAAMFCLGRMLWGRAAGLVAAVLYSYAPYHLMNAFERGAYSELTAFVWMPLVLLGFFGWMRGRTAGAFSVGVAGLVGLLLTHNLVPMLFLPAAACIVLAERGHWQGDLKAKLFGSCWMLIVAGMIAAFFMVPVVFDRRYVHMEYFLKYKYGLNFERWETLLGFVRRPGLILQIGALHVWGASAASVAIVICTLARRKIHYATTVLSCMALGWGALCMAQGDSEPIWRACAFLQIVQFPWRFLGVASLCFSLAAAGLIALLPQGKRRSVFAVSCCTGIVFAYAPLARIDKTVSAVEITERTEREAILLTQDYRPVTSRTAFDEARPDRANMLPVQYDDLPKIEAGEIAQHTREWNCWTLKYATEAATTMTLPQFYYPGFWASVDGVPTRLEPVTMHGLLAMQVPAGAHEVVVKYVGTTAQRVGNWITLMGLICWGVTLLIIKKRRPHASAASAIDVLSD